MLRALFGKRFRDVFSGYRALSRRFVKSFPGRSSGFEIETELTAHAVEIDVPFAEVETTYRARDERSRRKLRTFRDGIRILLSAVLMFKEMRPLPFFTSIAVALTVVALALGGVVIEEFLATGLVPRLPTAVLAASIQVVAFICLTAGIVLDSVTRTRREVKRLAYLALPPVRSDHGRNDLSSAVASTGEGAGDDGVGTTADATRPPAPVPGGSSAPSRTT